MILVTGGTGLLGAHLLYDLVKAGKKVKALKRTNSNLLQAKHIFSYYTTASIFDEIEWVDGDILDIFSLLDAMEGVEEIYHCAATVSFAKQAKDTLMKVNVSGTENIVNAAIERGIKKFCHVSSIAALGKAEDGAAISEETFWSPTTHTTNYAISKYGAEREVWRAVQEGLNVIVVNPSIIIGPGNWDKGSSKMFSTAYNGNKFYTNGVTGFVDVRDVSKAMIQLMDSPIKNERFILSSENISFQHFFNRIHSQLNIQLPYIKATKIMSEIIWRVGYIYSVIMHTTPLITKETARAAHQKSLFLNTKITAMLDFKFISIEQSIADTCKLFLNDKKF